MLSRFKQRHELRRYRHEYRYQELPDEGKNHIRIATIEPGTHDAIKIKLRIERFDDEFTPAYDAVSYVWGPPEENPTRVLAEHQEHNRGKLISCRGWLCGRSNLIAALWQFRHETEGRDVWIDALCIDQQDNVHKGPQVTMMGDIFSKASRVLVWLGPEKNDSTHAMDLVQRLGVQIDVQDWKKEKFTASEHAIEADVTDTNKPLDLTQRDLDALNHLFCRKWFDRLWVRQEIIRAKPEHAAVCVGRSSISWSIFRKGWHLLVKRQWTHIHPFWGRLSILRRFVRGDSNIDLDNLRETFEATECEDPRDRIYAVRSLFRREIQNAIIPDYTKSVETIYEEAAMAHVSCTHDLDFLRDCYFSPAWQGASWLPDWSCSTFPQRPLKWDAASGMCATRATTSEPGSLQVMGVFVAAITKILPINVTQDDGTWIYDSVVHGIYAILGEELRPLYSSNSKSETILEAYVKTIWDDLFVTHDSELAFLPRYDVANQVFHFMAKTLATNSISEASLRDSIAETLPNLENLENHIDSVFRRIVTHCDNRVLIHTSNGM
ncbi:heterokaryon incompatibility protein-domain-containing protein [Xylariaceae sp. FL1272]|nr:heterokaryon incompatibility protein-domain-containing protein [Xylariaceae sp. FL1272]